MITENLDRSILVFNHQAVAYRNFSQRIFNLALKTIPKTQTENSTTITEILKDDHINVTPMHMTIYHKY